MHKDRRSDDYFKRSLVPAMLVFILTVSVMGLSVVLIYTPIPVVNKDIAFIVYGALLAKWSDSVAYYIGTSHSSQEKNKIIDKRKREIEENINGNNG